MRIGIVVNPRARSASDPRLPARLQALAAHAGAACQVAVTDSPEDLPEILARLGAGGLDVLGVCGGDGTLMTTLSAVIAYYRSHAEPAALPALLLLPAGTMNTVAKNLGLAAQPERLFQAMLQAAQRSGLSAVPFWSQETLRVRTYGETAYRAPAPMRSDSPHPLASLIEEAPPSPNLSRKRARGRSASLLQQDDGAVPADVPRAAAESGSPPTERYGFLFSGAMGARFLAAYASGQPPGLRWASILALRTIASCLYPGGGALARWLFQPTPARLTVDCGDGQGPVAQCVMPYRLLLLATVPDVGLGMQVPWRASSVPGRFQLIASGLTTAAYALQVPRMRRGQPLYGSPHQDQLVVAVRLEFAAAQPLVLDGELFCAPTVEVALGPRLRVLRPSLLPPRPGL